MINLKPCPFCDCRALEVKRDGKAYFIECQCCYAAGPVTAKEIIAVSAWQKRVIAKAKGEAHADS